jgi:hypothetical protein
MYLGLAGVALARLITKKQLKAAFYKTKIPK